MSNEVPSTPEETPEATPEWTPGAEPADDGGLTPTPPAHTQQPYGQYDSPYAGPYGQYGPVPPSNPYGARATPAPSHDRAGLALGLGLTSLIGAFVCFGIPLLGAPFAWAIGQRSLREIRASNGQLSGEGMAMTGMVTGIVGTALLAVVVLLIVAFAIVLVARAGATG